MTGWGAGGRSRRLWATRGGWRRAARLVAVVGALLGAAAPQAAAPAPGAGPGPAGAPPPAVAAVAAGPDAALTLANRPVAVFRATLLGETPADRVALAQAALAEAGRGPGLVQRVTVGDVQRFEVDGVAVFSLVPEDLTGPRPALRLEAEARHVERQLASALAEVREARDPRRLAIGAAQAGAATVVAWLLLRAGRALWQAMQARLARRLDGLARGPATPSATPPGGVGAAARALAGHAQGGLRLGLAGLGWMLVLLMADVWVSVVLRQFPYTRPWGERSTAWLLDVLQQFFWAAAGAVPGLLTALLIFALARLATGANSAVMRRIERGELRAGWLDLDTAGPTRRLGNLAIWLFALAMAYPYLPGSDSEAFKGVTVLAGLVLSLGASGIVGQAMSGFSLMYARALRPGEYVRIGDTEGTVVSLGLFATKVHTGLGEEVSVPNAVVLTQPVRNYSRLVEGGQFMLQAGVTIGYATPWRQVHALLLEAARRTPGVATDPAPYVVQTALSDFYVEYRLCAYGTKAAPQRRAEAISALNAHVQDVFNENGVQIMSPHYRGDPPAPQVVPPGPWASRREAGGELPPPDQPADGAAAVPSSTRLGTRGASAHISS